MKNLYKTIILLLVILSLSATLSAAEDDDLRTSAEKFVRQICEKDSQAILHSYPMTDEFRAIVPDASVVVDWATEIDNLFGQLKDAVNAEIVDREGGLRSVYLYYQGTKRPAKIWVTFRGTDIAGFYYSVWTEGYTGREHSREKFGRFTGWLWALMVVFIISILVCAVGVILLKLFPNNIKLPIYGGFALVALTLAFPILLQTGEEDPTVEIVEDGIKISGRYGLKIDFTEIMNISLMENKISDIELTWRTFGYATDTALKGYFRSRKYGTVLLFTKTNSSPTIHIQRKGKADVFLNFSDNEATRALYDDLQTAFARYTVPRQ